MQNDYIQAINETAKILRETEAAHQIIVLLSDGLLAPHHTQQADGVDYRAALSSLLTEDLTDPKVDLFMVRLKCTIGVNNESLEDQAGDGYMWQESLPEHLLIGNQAEVLKNLISHPDLSNLFSPISRQCGDGQHAVCVTTEPGDYLLGTDSGSAYEVNLKSVGYGFEESDISIDGEDFPVPKKGDVFKISKTIEPYANCSDHTFYFQVKKPDSEEFLLIYWYDFYTYEEDLLALDLTPIMDPQAPLENNAAFTIGITPLGNQNPNFNLNTLQSLTACYELWVSLVDGAGEVIGQKIALLHEDSTCQFSLGRSQPTDGRIIVDLVEKDWDASKGSAELSSIKRNEDKPFTMRFKPVYKGTSGDWECKNPSISPTPDSEEQTTSPTAQPAEQWCQVSLEVEFGEDQYYNDTSMEYYSLSRNYYRDTENDVLPNEVNSCPSGGVETIPINGEEWYGLKVTPPPSTRWSVVTEIPSNYNRVDCGFTFGLLRFKSPGSSLGDQPFEVFCDFINKDCRVVNEY